MAWVPLGLLGKRVGADDLIPLGCRSQEEVGTQIELGGSLLLEPRCEITCASTVTRKDRVPAVEQRSGIAQAQLGQQIAQGIHRHLAMAAQVDRAQQS